MQLFSILAWISIAGAKINLRACKNCLLPFPQLHNNPKACFLDLTLSHLNAIEQWCHLFHGKTNCHSFAYMPNYVAVWIGLVTLGRITGCLGKCVFQTPCFLKWCDCRRGGFVGERLDICWLPLQYPTPKKFFPPASNLRRCMGKRQSNKAWMSHLQRRINGQS